MVSRLFSCGWRQGTAKWRDTILSRQQSAHQCALVGSCEVDHDRAATTSRTRSIAFSRIALLGDRLAHDGHPTRVEYRWASGHYDRLPALTAELVGLPVLVFAASGGEPAVLAKRSFPQPNCIW